MHLRRRRGLVAILALFNLQASANSYSDGGTVLSEPAIREKMDYVCDQVNEFYKQRHFNVVAPIPVGCTFSYDYNTNYKVRTGKFGATYTSNLDAEVVASSGTTISFFNWDAFQAAYGPKAPVFPENPPSHWTRDHAIQIAGEFATIFTKAWGCDLGKPTAEFHWPAGLPPKASLGEWTVSWPRESKLGIPFLSNGVEVSLTEVYGPHTIEIGFSAQYDDNPVHAIPSARALEEAQKDLTRILNWAPAKHSFAEMRINTNPRVKLFIVQPNDLLAQKSLQDAAFSRQITARLAWVVTYGLYNSTDPSLNGAVSVFVDAKDGSFLGGVF